MSATKRTHDFSYRIPPTSADFVRNEPRDEPTTGDPKQPLYRAYGVLPNDREIVVIESRIDPGIRPMRYSMDAWVEVKQVGTANGWAWATDNRLEPGQAQQFIKCFKYGKYRCQSDEAVALVSQLLRVASELRSCRIQVETKL